MTDCHAIVSLLPDYAASRLQPEETRLADEHLGDCAECRDKAKRMREFFNHPVEREPVPDGYWTTILPRVRERTGSKRPFELPEFAVRFLSPAFAALVLIAVASQLLPGTGGWVASPDASAPLTGLEEEELFILAERHDAESLLSVESEDAVSSASESEDDLLQEIVDGEARADLYAYAEPDLALEDLADEDQVLLVSMLEHE